MAFFVENGYPVFTDLDGEPLENGYIFIGVENLNPLSNPQNAFWDEALTIPAVDIRTRGGYAVYKGSPGRIHTSAKYSLLVQDRNRNTVYYQPTTLDPFANQPVPQPGVGGLPLGTILPENGVTFPGFLSLGSTNLSQTTYADLFASSIDLIKDNGDGTFDIRNSGGTTGWVANATWTGITITVTHNLNVDMTDLDFEVFVSSLGTEATAIRVLDTSVYVTPAANFTGGLSAYGLDADSFLVRTGDDGLDLIDTDGTRLTLTNQNWYYKISYKRKDMPFPAQVNYREASTALDGDIVKITLRRDTEANWASDNPILASGEPGFATDIFELKIGNGILPWTSLPGVELFSLPSAPVFDVLITNKTVSKNVLVQTGTNGVGFIEVILAVGVTLTVESGADFAVL